MSINKSRALNLLCSTLAVALAVACSNAGSDTAGAGGASGGAVDAQVSGRDGAVVCVGACAAGTRQCGPDEQVQVCADYDGDGCNDWGGDLDCPPGSACSDGACVPACGPAVCTLGEAVCGADGRRECAAVGPDGCTEFGPGVPCAAGERCDGGACVPEDRPCTDACGTDGLRECSGAGYRTCGQYDEDACLDWSPTVACEPGDACSAAGECVPDCTDECIAGGTVCQGAGVSVCGNFDRDACLELGPAMACRPDERCDGGACVPADQPCEDECLQADGRICADGGSFRQCGQYDVDACLELSAPVRCGAAEACTDGQCVRVCDDECVDGGAQCVAAGVETCGNFDADPCLEWSGTVPCGANERCDDGACVESVLPCEDACAAGEARCGVIGIETCGNYDDDACTEFSAEQPCAAGQRCELGACVDDCVDDCAAGATDCDAGGVVTCGEFDGDACLEFGLAEACPADQSCSGGACRAICIDDCALDGASACTPAGEVQTCGNYDAEVCLEWSSPVPCGADQTCVDGACVVVCRDECQADARRCVGDAYEVCGDFDADACLEFGGGGACGAGEVCAMGACQTDCVDDCAAGAGECTDDGARQCGNFDGDACREWSAPTTCGAWQTCDAGACRDLPVPPGVVINEVFYDADVVADREQSFIELHGPAGTSLSGFTLVGVNGNGGADYVSIDLAGTLAADGFHVVAHPDAVALAGVADQLDTGADLQNGPDSLQLRWGDTVVDAVAYGVFGAGDTAAGEGMPAAGAAPGRSITRNAQHTDTNDNRADFAAAAEPSPGAALPCQDTCPNAGDVQCNGAVAERCGPAGAGCLAWNVVSDCGAAGQLCRNGACEAAPVCVVPTGILRANPIAGVYAQNPCLDVLPVPGAGFAVVGAAPTAQLKFALTDIDGTPTSPVRTFGPTNIPPWGNAAADTYYPDLDTDGQQYMVTWSGFSNQGNRDIFLRRITLAGQVIDVPNGVISQGTKGFSPSFFHRAGGLDVLFNAYRQWKRIPISNLGEPGPMVNLGTAHGDTREETFMSLAQTDAGSRAMLYVTNTVDFGSPRAFFQALDANGGAVGNRVDLGVGEAWSGYPGVLLFGLPGDRYGALWRTVVGVQTPTQSIMYAVLDRNGVVQSSVVLNDLAAPAVYRPNMLPISMFFDGERIGVVHDRYFDQLEPRHFAIQWLTPAGAHIARTELGNTRGILVKHPDDGLFRLFEYRGQQTDVLVHVLGCP
jgi:hypothetical protein